MKYPINRKKHEAIVKAAKRRLKGGVTVIDPLSKLPLPKYSSLPDLLLLNCRYPPTMGFLCAAFRLEMRPHHDHLMSRQYLVPAHLRYQPESVASVVAPTPQPAIRVVSVDAAPYDGSGINGVVPPHLSIPNRAVPRIQVVTVPAAAAPTAPTAGRVAVSPPQSNAVAVRRESTASAVVPASDSRHQSGLDFFSLFELRSYLSSSSQSTVRSIITVHIIVWALVFGVNIFAIVWLGINFDLMSIFVSLAAIAIAFEYLHYVRYNQVESLNQFSKQSIAVYIIACEATVAALY